MRFLTIQCKRGFTLRPAWHLFEAISSLYRLEDSLLKWLSGASSVILYQPNTINPHTDPAVEFAKTGSCGKIKVWILTLTSSDLIIWFYLCFVKMCFYCTAGCRQNGKKKVEVNNIPLLYDGMNHWVARPYQGNVPLIWSVEAEIDIYMVDRMPHHSWCRAKKELSVFEATSGLVVENFRFSKQEACFHSTSHQYHCSWLHVTDNADPVCLLWKKSTKQEG